VKKVPANLFNYKSDTDYNNITQVTFQVICACESIGAYSFAYCKNLLAVYYCPDVMNLGSLVAFTGCDKVTYYEYNGPNGGGGASFGAR
jgi:hypothetical protein